MKANNDILIKVEPNRIKSPDVGKVKITITNTTSENVTTGTYYSIESYEGTSWKKLKLLDKIVFEDIAFNINPSRSKEFLINLQLIPYNYVPGKYRIGKEVVSGGQRLIVSSEFTVE